MSQAINSRVFEYFGINATNSQWSDWHWQYAHRVTDAATLSQLITLSDQEKQDIQRCLGNFRMAITPYFASLMSADDPHCPIRRQVIPSIAETVVSPVERPDPLDEDGHSPVPGIVHRYPDRVLFLVTRQCAMYCRYCIRKRHVGEEDFRISEDEKAAALDYIARTPQVRDVLISGGDPLTLADADLEDILARLRAIPHVEIIRIGTRVPAALPMRVTPELAAMLRRYQPLWINTHFNHPQELTAAASLACARLADAGIPLGNQSVLLRGVNDNVETMQELLLKLVQMRVRPYYLYQCDLCEGVSHFRTRVEAGLEIIRALTGNISGFAVPRFVIDTPQGGGKVPVNPQFVLSITDQQVEMLNYQGKLFHYPQPDLPWPTDGVIEK
ncbi:MAG: KamA family radical SAM protein [Actinomycetia bacterium]|nr:KamA family radical SAM protein [Actinomycetes bacterium]